MARASAEMSREARIAVRARREEIGREAYMRSAPADHPQVVVVVYLPAGHGAEAAQVAAKLFSHSPFKRPQT